MDYSSILQNNRESLFFAILGAIIGFILPLFFRFIFSAFKYFYLRLFKKDNSVFLGKWYCYHYSSEFRKIIFVQGSWKIKLGLIGYKAVSSDIDRPKLVYEGRLKLLNDSTLALIMHGKGSTEEYYVKIQYPIPNMNGITYGIKVGIDFDNTQFSTIYLFSRNRLQRDEAEKLLDEKLNSFNKLLRV